MTSTDTNETGCINITCLNYDTMETGTVQLEFLADHHRVAYIVQDWIDEECISTNIANGLIINAQLLLKGLLSPNLFIDCLYRQDPLAPTCVPEFLIFENGTNQDVGVEAFSEYTCHNANTPQTKGGDCELDVIREVDELLLNVENLKKAFDLLKAYDAQKIASPFLSIVDEQVEDETETEVLIVKVPNVENDWDKHSHWSDDVSKEDDFPSETDPIDAECLDDDDDDVEITDEDVAEDVVEKPTINDFEESDYTVPPSERPSMQNPEFAARHKHNHENFNVVNASKVAPEEDATLNDIIGSGPTLDAPTEEPKEVPVLPAIEEATPSDLVTYFAKIISDDEAVPSDLTSRARAAFDRRMDSLRSSLREKYKAIPDEIRPEVTLFDAEAAGAQLGDELFSNICIVKTDKLLRIAGDNASLLVSATHAARSLGHIEATESLTSVKSATEFFVQLISKGNQDGELNEHVNKALNRITAISDVRLEEADNAIAAYASSLVVSEKLRQEVEEHKLIIDGLRANAQDATQNDRIDGYILKNPEKENYIAYRRDDHDFLLGNLPKLNKLYVTKHAYKAFKFPTEEKALSYLNRMQTAENIKCKHPKKFVPHAIMFKPIGERKIAALHAETDAKVIALENGELPIRRATLPLDSLQTPYNKPFRFPASLESMQHHLLFDANLLPEGATIENIYSGEYKNSQSDVIDSVDVQEEFFHKRGLHVNVGTMPNGNFYIETWKIKDWKIHSGVLVLKNISQSEVEPTSIAYLSKFGSMTLGDDMKELYATKYKAFVDSYNTSDELFEENVMIPVFGGPTPYKGRVFDVAEDEDVAPVTPAVKKKKKLSTKTTGTKTATKKKLAVKVTKKTSKSSTKKSSTKKTKSMTPAEKRKLARSKRK